MDRVFGRDDGDRFGYHIWKITRGAEIYRIINDCIYVSNDFQELLPRPGRQQRYGKTRFYRKVGHRN